MKKKTPDHVGPSLTPDEVEHITYSALRDSAKLFPKSIDDLETLESELEGVELPKPDMSTLLKVVRGELPEPELKLRQHGEEPQLVDSESLALAARHGSAEIAEDIRSKMDADRGRVCSSDQGMPGGMSHAELARLKRPSSDHIPASSLSRSSGDRSEGRRESRTETIRLLAEGLAELHCPTGRVDPHRLLEAAKITISFNHYGNAFDGALEHKSGRFHTYCNLDRVRSCNTPRARFTIAHELGHYHINEHRTALERGLTPMHGSIANRPDSDIVMEQEADLFASHLLLPRPRYRQLLDTLPADVSGLYRIIAVANAFDVSVQATAVRFCQDMPGICGIVMWRKEDPAWSYVAPAWDASGYPRPRRDKDAICDGSATALALAEPGVGRINDVHQTTSTAAFWFPRVAKGGTRDTVMIEQAVRLGSFGVLTLLMTASR